MFVGEPFVLVLQAKYVQGTNDLQIVQSPNFEGVLQKELDTDGERTTGKVDGRTVEVYNFQKRLIIPNTPGTLGGSDLVMTAQVPVKTDRFDMFGRPYYMGMQKTASAKVPAVTIKPLPTPKPEGFSGGVGDLKLSRKVSRTTLNGDESLTITLRLEGSGNLNTLSVPELTAPEGFDLYDPKYSEDLSYTTRGLRGYKSNEYLLVPQFKGTFELPEQTWTFFNSTTQTYQTVTLPAETIQVLTGPNKPADETATGGAVAAVEKRKVKNIDTDIRYLQELEPARKPLVGRRGLWWILALLGLAWAFQAWQPGAGKEDEQARWRAVKKGVEKAFAQNDPQRVALLVHALEQRLFERHGRFAIQLEELQQRYDEPVARALVNLYERCQLAQYAPISATAQDELLIAFKELWKQL